MKRPRKDGSGSGGGIGLADLVAAGYLKPGRNKVAVAYKGERVTATLTKEGIIIWQGDPQDRQACLTQRGWCAMPAEAYDPPDTLLVSPLCVDVVPAQENGTPAQRRSR